ncbi:MAG: quinolinate synthase NadA [Candidatus Methanofastidiosia archaeon]
MSYNGVRVIRGDTLDIIDKINALKEEKDIAILAHNYQPPEVQDIADYLGDSLDLCYRAQNLEEGTILFAGVKFMAESALILNPEKTVLLPEPNAYCPMAEMLTPDIITKKKEQHPDASVVLYGNTTAASKALSDIICTSANAAQIVEAADSDTILFGPDKNLLHWTQQQTDKTLVPIPNGGYCYVHNLLIRPEDVLYLKSRHPDAKLLVHPECVPQVQSIADNVLSTNGMLKIASISSEKEFIIGTEKELCHRLRNELPNKIFYEVEHAICADMKKITLEKIYHTMKTGDNKMELPKKILDAAREPLERMLAVGRKN